LRLPRLGTACALGHPDLEQEAEGLDVIILGVILLILGAVLDISILWTIGIILVVVGAVLWILGSMDRAVGPRRHYW
jgi:membrane-bound ClpP family serine protease